MAINGSMVKSNVDGLVANYTGDYFAFQAYFESVNMSSIYCGPFSLILTRPCRVLTSVLTPSWEGTWTIASWPLPPSDPLPQ